MRFGCVRLGLAPGYQLVVQTHPDGRLEYESDGDDPQFQVLPDGGCSALAPGWYLFSAQMELVDGEIITPCFYPDYGEGPSEASRIDLPGPADNGRLDAVVLIKRPLRALRFDPTIRRARFTLSGAALRRISRPRAVFHMLSGIQQATRRMFWEDSLAALGAFLGLVAKGQVSEAAESLLGHYRNAFRQRAQGYLHWIQLFDSRAPARTDRAGKHVAQLAHQPLVSIVLPVHNTAPALLRSCIESVLAQTYPNWQLCIADDASSGSTRKILKEYAAKDPRIEVHFRSHHGHICETSNNALDLARGEFVGFLDHDDELTRDALYETVMAIERHPGARLCYSDEDKIDETGKRFDPNFKPAWNPELLLSQNYICHFVVLDTALVREVGGLRPGFEGAQDHDLILRCTEKLQRHQIVHIPKVLYHWRATVGSTALGGDQKPYSLEAGRRAVEQHLARTGANALVECTAAGYYSVQRKLGEVAPSLTIVIPSRDRKRLLSACIDSILERTDYPNYHVMVVDNGSVEADAVRYLEELRAHPRVTVLDYPAPFNFSAIVNHAVRHTDSELICILNNDVEVITPGWLGEMVVHARRPEVGVVGCMLYYPDDTIQHAGVVLGIGGVAGHVHWRLPRGSDGYLGRAGVTQNFTAVTGACMVLRRDVFESVAGLDENLPVAFNDIDFCIRVARHGYFNVWTPRAELYHHESASRGLEDTPEKQARFNLEAAAMKLRWGDSLLDDPAYNPNLSLDGSHFELAFPPRIVQGNAARVAMNHPEVSPA